MKQQNVHYFPGHMQKALREMQNYIKTVDLIVEICDARAPKSSRNPLLDELCGNKSRLILLGKSDCADDAVTKKWLDFYKEKGVVAVAGNMKKDRFVSILSSVSEPLVAPKRAKEARFGMKPQPIRAMIIGIPNVGKSTLINNIGGKKAAKVGNKAGVTRAAQWIKLNKDFTLLDTPGILPMNYPTQEQAMHLALLGSMREDVLPTQDLASSLLSHLKESYPYSLKERFGIEDISNMNNDDVFLEIANVRGLLDGNRPSMEKAAYLLVKEFKDGLLGRISLEEVQC
ncbi:MAG: ribosome biogenesis GTPase YlqF [Bacilli bacterium]|nr:ribosome biogenesis GTPase YlqF [Bacilli bacterium]